VLAPNLKIRKGIVVTSRDSLSGAQGVTYSPSLNTGGVTFPATIGSVPFSGTVSSGGISLAGGNGSTGAVKTCSTGVAATCSSPVSVRPLRWSSRV